MKTLILSALSLIFASSAMAQIRGSIRNIEGKTVLKTLSGTILPAPKFIRKELGDMGNNTVIEGGFRNGKFSNITSMRVQLFEKVDTPKTFIGRIDKGAKGNLVVLSNKKELAVPYFLDAQSLVKEGDAELTVKGLLNVNKTTGTLIMSPIQVVEIRF